ncbi:organic solvent ABC transporter substrate-binding protein [Neiella marina]|uniref:Organic solvent ABC transporter substrate-binding protein n=1 Tax=Neiella marina TaxID=508461 RepID=A0A8J2U701_9GAMM|nr:ABC transporter substrate-binding protein [Neiella marina]GGA83171.1 organic solvent ABC transporter substrate-binding protein [Neiella marina]
MTVFVRVLLISFSFLTLSAWASVDTSDPQVMLSQIANETSQKLKQTTAEQHTTEFLRNVVEQDLLPHVDYRFAALKVLGVEVRQTNKEQRAAFSEAFKDYMVGTFTLLFKRYDPQRHVIEVDPVRIPGQVPARFVEQGKPDIKVIFYMRQNSKTGEWKVWDLAAEGISQVETKNKEFRPLLRQHGIDFVTQQLRTKVDGGLNEDELAGFGSGD